MSKRLLLLLGLVLTVGLIAGGCGGSDSSTTPTTATTEDTSAVTGDTGAAPTDEQAAVVDQFVAGCQSAIDEDSSGISANEESQLLDQCAQIATTADSPEEAAVQTCEATAELLNDVSAADAQAGCKDAGANIP
jgi:hypothetical protein